MAQFELPEAPDLPEPPPPDPMAAREEKIANDTRVESEINRFLAARQDALFHAPDAFYRTEGEDAIHAAPETSRKLDALRRDLIDRAANDYQRGRLGRALGAQMELTRDGMARHVAEQSLAWQRQVAQDRIALLTKEAALHHTFEMFSKGIRECTIEKSPPMFLEEEVPSQTSRFRDMRDNKV